jgi:hypothetical protein
MNNANGNVSVCQAVTGPVMLILVGTLFALDHFTDYSFSRTWPLLLIVFGLLKLWCRGGSR